MENQNRKNIFLSPELRNTQLNTFLFLVFLLFSEPGLFAWTSHTHRSMAEDAARLMPASLRKILQTWNKRDRAFELSASQKKLSREFGFGEDINLLRNVIYPPVTEKRLKRLKKQLQKRTGYASGRSRKLYCSKFKWPKGALQRGAVQPDLDFHDYQNHIMHCIWLDKARRVSLSTVLPGREILDCSKRTYNRYFISEGSADKRGNGAVHISYLASEIVARIKSGKLHDADLSWMLGVLCHYIADLNIPLHATLRIELPFENQYHHNFEKDLSEHLTKAKNIFFGFNTKNPPHGIAFSQLLKRSLFNDLQYIDDLKLYFEKNVRDIYPFARVIDRAYMDYSGNIPHKREGFQRIRKLAFQWYCNSVNDIADAWFTIWVRAGKVTGKDNWKLKFSNRAWRYREKNNIARFSCKKINLNCCNTEELLAIKGLGQKSALKIIKNRPYRNIRDLEYIFPEKKVKKWRKYLSVH
ncbi:ComEA family DNA-binding protein [Candidatus Riflebacteria bacterium]